MPYTICYFCQMSQLKIAVIGNGNAGSFFKQALDIHQIKVKTFARNPAKNEKSMESLVEKISDYDMIILAVNDSAIKTVSAMLPTSNALYVHCSGGLDMGQIDAKHKRRGVFYPLMSLKGKLKIDPKSIPFCLEAETDEDMDFMADLIHRLGATYYTVDSEKRAHLHIAAVLAQNFTNHLYHLAKTTLQEVELDFKILTPLIENSVKKLASKEPEKLQTGPAIRRDEVTIQKHLDLIKDPVTRDIYKLLTQSIQRTHDEKL